MPAVRMIHRIRPGYPRYLTQDRLRKLREDFNIHRWNAKMRSIEFTLSFGEWLGIWIASGKVLRRGCRRGQYAWRAIMIAGLMPSGMSASSSPRRTTRRLAVAGPAPRILRRPAACSR